MEKAPDADLSREMIGFTAERLMELEVGGLTGAAWGEKGAERLVSRGGYRDRVWETRDGTVAPRIPKLRKRSCFPGLPEPRRKALTAVIREACVHGGPTRSVDDLVKALGMGGVSQAAASSEAGRRYVSPRRSIARSARDVLCGTATAATFIGRRAISAWSQGRGLTFWRNVVPSIARAPWIRSVLRYRSPPLLVRPMCSPPPLAEMRGVNPGQAAKWRVDRNWAPSPIAATSAVAVSGSPKQRLRACRSGAA